MGSDFNSFKERHDYLIQHQQDINSCMYAFGALQGSSYFGHKIGVYNPISDKLKSQWSSDDLLRVKFGYDDNKKSDEDFGGIIHWEYGIKRAVEFKRPDWGFFYWVGYIKSMLNSGEEDNDELLRCLQFIPVSFFEKHGKRIEELCNYFDEKGEELHIEIKDGKVNAWFKKKTSS